MDNILYEDNHVIAINKPAGLLTQPSGTDRQSAEEMIKAYIKESCDKKGAVFLEAVHRLDFATSGVCLFARTSKALSRLVKAVREKCCRKIYWALIEGTLPEKGELVCHLQHGDRRAFVVEEGGKEAILRYHMLRQSLVEVELVTGRFHQIRAQLANEGCPIVGDAKYGSEITLPKGAIALHSKQITFPHPIGGEEMTIEAPAPAIFLER